MQNNLKNRTSIIAHAFIPNCFYCSGLKKFISNPDKATVYNSDEARGAGIAEVEAEFKNFKRGQVIMHYLT